MKNKPALVVPQRANRKHYHAYSGAQRGWLTTACSQTLKTGKLMTTVPAGLTYCPVCAVRMEI